MKRPSDGTCLRWSARQTYRALSNDTLIHISEDNSSFCAIIAGRSLRSISLLIKLSQQFLEVEN